jgi:hypothetical protein
MKYREEYLFRRVPLYDREGKHVGDAFVDPRFFEEVMRHRWYRVPQNERGERFYACTAGLLYLHQLVWRLGGRQVPAGKMLDHINLDPADCRLENLRVAASEQNLLHSWRPGKSGMMYVGMDEKRRKFVVRGAGSFDRDNEEAAGRAADAKRIAKTKPKDVPFLCLNFDPVTGERLRHGEPIAEHHFAPYVRHEKSCPDEGVSLVRTLKDGTPVYRVNLMRQGVKYDPREARNYGIARSLHDEMCAEAGLPRRHFPGFSGRVTASVGVSYAVTR